MKKNYRKKSVYVTLAVDFVHDGHINILNVAKNYGESNSWSSYRQGYWIL